LVVGKTAYRQSEGKTNNRGENDVTVTQPITKPTVALTLLWADLEKAVPGLADPLDRARSYHLDLDRE
jgi:hypothetical protein